jgi:NAD(P)-dependent dehydrogenase (short-subunit alcohol dehydrogenase family)
MDDRLAGKVCLITGAAQGIGAAYARRMASAGADIAIVDLKRIDQAGEVVADIEALGRRAIAVQADVTDAEAMKSVASQTISELGGIDCLVNNAALMFDQLTATWEDHLAVNFMGVVNASNAVIPHMWERHAGSIVNISSTAAFPLPLGDPSPIPEDAPPPPVDPQGYGLTKWMLIFHTRQMARTLGGRNIRVNAVCPGVTMSPATKAVVPAPIVDRLAEAAALHSTLEPEDMTGIVLFLASDDSAKMTGQTIVNDAGTHFAA